MASYTSPSGRNRSVFDRLSQTDTYASRRLKEKVPKPKETGRPLYNIEIESEPKYPYSSRGEHIPRINKASSNSTASTCSSSSNTQNSSIRRSNSRSGSIFDRLAKTGTQSSLRKDKTSLTYDDRETFAESEKSFTWRNYGKGSTLLLTQNSKKCDENMSKNSFLQYQYEGEI